MKQKILIVLAIILIGITSKVQAQNFSAVAPSGQTLYYNILTSNTIGITSELSGSPYYYTKPSGGIIIPDSVTFNGITYSVTSIGSNAFISCTGLTSIAIPNSVTSIGDNAFRNCISLTSITIGSNISSIGKGVFYQCSSLTSISVDINNQRFYSDNGVLYNKNSDTLICYPCAKTGNFTIPNSVSSIDKYAFSFCIGLTSIIITNSVTSIGDFAFSDCQYLSSVTLPNSITSIGNLVFYRCSSLTSIIIPNSVTSLGGAAFGYCSSLTSISISSSITSLNGDAFHHCSSLTSINVDINNSKYSSIDGVLFNKNADTLIFYPCGKNGNYSIPNSVKSIRNSAFMSSIGLTSITIPNSVTSIGSFLFSDCTGLTSISIPNSIKSINDYSFSNCSSLSYVTIGNSLKTIGACAFAYCSSLLSLIIPDSVTSIGNNAFQNCKSMTNISIPNSVSYIGVSAFDSCISLTSVIIPETITYIHMKTFSNCTDLSSVTIGESVSHINWGAFSQCSSLTSLTIPKSVKSISSFAFSQCSGLTSITCKSLKPPTIESSSTFSGISSTIPIYIPCGSSSAYDSSIYWSSFSNIISVPEKNFKITVDTLFYGQIYTEHGQSISSSGIYDFNDGCDSINLTIVVLPYSFTAQTTNGQILYYKITSSANPFTVEIVSELSHSPFYNTLPAGTLIIPATVTNNGITYNINSISDSAFYLCTGISSIISKINTPPSIGYSTFFGVTKTIPVYIPCGTAPSYNNSLVWNSFSNIVAVPEKNYISIYDTIYYGNTYAYTQHDQNITAAGVYNFNDGCDSIKLTVTSVSYSFKSQASSGQMLYYRITSPTTVGVVTESTTEPVYKIRPSGAIIIPDSVTYNGNIYAVTSLEQGAFYRCQGLTSVIIPNTVKSIGQDAFYDCIKLTSVLMPDSIISIGKSAFSNCVKLLSINIPNSVTSIGYYAFQSCSSLTSLTIGNSLPTISSYCFAGCTGLTSVIIPNSVNIISNGSFADCRGLTYVSISDSIKSIFQNAFLNCIKLTSITIPESDTLIGDKAFYGCVKLDTINFNAINCISMNSPFNGDSISVIIIGNQVTRIPNNAFAGIKRFKTVILPNSVLYVGTSAFYGCPDLMSITIPNSVTYLGNSAFSNCSLLNSLTLSNSISSIGDYLLEGCTNLTSLSIPNSVKSIGYASMRGCSSLKNIIIGDSVSSINFRSFYNCSSLSSLTIGKSLISIENYAFKNCSSLTSIIIKATNPPTIQSQTFDSVSKIIPVYVPCGSKSNYQTKQFWSNFTNFAGNGDSRDTITANICNGQIYNQYGFYANSTGLYTRNLQTFNGCDSIITLNLTVNPIYDDTIIAKICQGHVYNQNGFNADSTGTYTQNLQTINGCDSIITLNLTVTPNYYDTINASICQGQVYNQYGFNAVSTGVYYQNLQTINGCDSIITLNLTVYPIYQTSYTDSICQGQVYNNYGFNFVTDTTGVYTQSLQNVNGCDSIITLNLTVNPSPITPSGLLVERKHSYLEITWDCVGESYEVYRDDSLIATTSQAIYQDSNVVNDSSYCYKVKAFIGSCESDFSDISCMKFVGLNDININNQDINLYPNPTNGKAKLSIESLNDKAQVNIFDLTGRILKTYIIDTNQKELEIDLSGFAKGVYNISINNNNTNISKKLVIQ